MAEESPRATTPTLLADISNRLAVIEARLEIIADHETRIRELEKARWQSAWITSISSAVIVSVIITMISKGF
jgi:hypothetical protein